MQTKRATPAALAVLLALAIAGCGNDGATTSTGQGKSSTETQTTATQPAPRTGPRGSLDFDSIGPVKQGASTGEVRRAFGPADRTSRQVGCELAGPNAPEVVQWTWDLEDGDFTLTFDADTGKFKSYRTNSSKLPTAAGIRVGDNFAALEDGYGRPPLEPLLLGSEEPSAQSGVWFVRVDDDSQLTFTFAGGKVRTIAGGLLEVCE